MTPQQEAAERDIIFAMITMLRDLRDAGHSDWQTLTSFLANLLMGHDNPPKMAKTVGGRCETEAQPDAPDAGGSLADLEMATLAATISERSSVHLLIGLIVYRATGKLALR